MSSDHDVQDRQGVSRRTLLTGAAVGGAGLAAALVESNPVAAAVAPTGGRQGAIAAVKEPGVGNSFELVAPGIGTFSKFLAVSGLTSEVEVVEFRDGSDPMRVVLVPGIFQHPSIRLSRPVDRDQGLAAWHEAVLAGSMDTARTNCTLTIHSYEGQPVARYHLENAWPAKVDIGALTVGSSEVLMETITIVCEHIQRVPV